MYGMAKVKSIMELADCNFLNYLDKDNPRKF